MKRLLLLLGGLWVAPVVWGDVRVFVQQTNGLANINYVCTAGEVVRAFALYVTVDRGQILGVTNFFRGPSTIAAQGYGIFPASLRDNIAVYSGTNADWNASSYSPLAVAADNPGGTLPGLNSAGVTLELGAIWDPSAPAAAPPSRGTLCAVQISQTANVMVTANSGRGGVVASPPDMPMTVEFAGGLVGPAITGAKVVDGTITVLFQGGELESAPSIEGPWVGTGNATGAYSESLGTSPAEFYRVHNH